MTVCSSQRPNISFKYFASTVGGTLRSIFQGYAGLTVMRCDVIKHNESDWVGGDGLVGVSLEVGFLSDT